MFETVITITVKSLLLKLISMTAVLQTANIIYFKQKIALKEKQVKAMKISKESNL